MQSLSIVVMSLLVLFAVVKCRGVGEKKHTVLVEVGQLNMPSGRRTDARWAYPSHCHSSQCLVCILE
jgi:hypothetical protein